MIRRPPRSTRTTHSFPTRRTSDLSLGITGSAVSHRIRGLESELGVHLLRRTPRGLILTDAGRRYRGAVEDAFAGLTQATSDLLGPDLSRPLTISLDRKSTRLNSSH